MSVPSVDSMEDGTRRRVRAVASSRTDNSPSQPLTSSNKIRNDTRTRGKLRPSSVSAILLLVTTIAVLCYWMLNAWSRAYLLRCVTLVPVALCSYSSAALARQRKLEYTIPLALVLTVVSAQLPSYLAVGIATASIVAFGLATRPIQVDVGTTSEKVSIDHAGNANAKGVGPITVLLAVAVVIAVLLTENFLIWVVSATFEAGQNVQTEPLPLQDNGQRVLKYVLSPLSKSQVVGLRRLWNTQWSLVSCLGASFAFVELQQSRPTTTNRNVHRTLFGLATRMAWTMAMARLVRTVSFLLTVLPSQVHNCYAQRFPVPPPTDWTAWIWVGLIPRSHGGCNDLIISGHATVTSSSTFSVVCSFGFGYRVLSVRLSLTFFSPYINHSGMRRLIGRKRPGLFRCSLVNGSARLCRGNLRRLSLFSGHVAWNCSRFLALASLGTLRGYTQTRKFEPDSSGKCALQIPNGPSSPSAQAIVFDYVVCVRFPSCGSLPSADLLSSVDYQFLDCLVCFVFRNYLRPFRCQGRA
jgi:hypothetical protein